MFYQILKFIATLAFKSYFRKIYVHGEEHIPPKGAILMVSNHPAAFMEACLLACFQPRSLYFLVRGDLYENKWLNPIMNATHQIPIYRFRDGYQKLKSNLGTFTKSYDILNKEEALLIFGEGSTEQVQWLRPIQKGAARIVDGTWQMGKLNELYVLPIGVNYSDITHTRTFIQIAFGKPIAYSAYQKYESDKELYSALTENIEREMDELVLSIKQPAEIPTWQDFLILHYNNHRKADDDQVWAESQKLLKGFNQLTEDEHNVLKQKLDAYFKEKRSKILFDKFVSREGKYGIQDVLFVVLMLIPALIGMVFHLPISIFSKYLSKKLISEPEFYPPVRMSMNIVFQIILYLNVFVGLAFFIGMIKAFIIAVFVLPICGHIAMLYLDKIKEIGMLFEFKNNLQEFVKKRKEIIGIIDN